jgi:hypothetical protein
MTEELYFALDPDIRDAVRILQTAGIETFESCQGGNGHALPEPTIRFHGEHGEGFRALAVAFENGVNVLSLRRAWSIEDGEPTGPCWEIVVLPSKSR